MSNKICNIPVGSIKPPWVIMRLVDKNSLDYMELRDSIRDIGITQSLSVRQLDCDKYELVTGLHRFTIAKELDIEIVPCIIVVADNVEVIQHQIQENCCLRRPNHIQLARHVKKLLLADTDLTLADLAYRLHKSPGWVRKVLSLNYLIPPARKMLEQCEFSMDVGVILAKLPKTIQEELLEDALNMTAGEFSQHCLRISRSYKTASKQGVSLNWYTQHISDPEPALRPLIDLRSEYNNCCCGSLFLSKDSKIPLIQVWKAALAWVLQLDPDSVEAHYEQIQRTENARKNALIRRRASRATLKELQNRPDDERDLDDEIF